MSLIILLLHDRLPNIQVKGHYLNRASINDMKRSFFCFIDKSLANRDKVLSLLLALRHILIIWSSNFNSLLIVMPRNLTWYFFPNLSFPNIYHKCSKRWSVITVIRNSHFSAFSFILSTESFFLAFLWLPLKNYRIH